MSADLLRALEGLHDLVLVLDAEGNCRHAGPRLLPTRFFREGAGTSDGLALADLFEPDLVDLLQSLALETAPGRSTHLTHQFEGRGGHYELEAVRSESGELTVLGRVRDEDREPELTRDQAALAQVMETGLAGVCIFDTSGRITYANRSAEQILGLTRSELTQRRYNSPQWRITSPDGAELSDAELPFQRVLATSQPVYDDRIAIDRGDGMRMILSINGAPVLDESGVVERLAFTILDITRATAQSEETLRANRELESLARLESLAVLAGGVAHDFNNILVGVLGGAELVCAQIASDHPARSAVELMEQGAKRASELTHQLLAFSGKSRFKVGPRDLSQVVRESSRLLEAMVSKDAQLTISLAEDLPQVEIDSTQVGQMLMNIVLNSSQALRGGGKISVATRCAPFDEDDLREAALRSDDAGPGTYVILEVSDNGVGMSPAVAARVFEPFFSTKPEGHGLGLAAVIGVIRSHGGFVQVHTALDEGTTFALGFPILEGAAPAVQQSAPKGGGKFVGTVLVIDDEAFVRTVTQRVLEHEGCDVLTAEDGIAGLALFKASTVKIDAVVLDLTMPRMPGEAVLAALRELAPDLHVVVTSGYTDESPFQTDPATRFLAKPFGRTALLEALSR